MAKSQLVLYLAYKIKFLEQIFGNFSSYKQIHQRKKTKLNLMK